MIDKILDQIAEAKENMTFLDLIVASNIARGLGEKKIKKILQERNIIKEYYNKEITKKEIYDYVHNLEGFDDITTSLFVDNLPKFIELLKKLPKDLRTKLLTVKKNKKGKLFENYKIVFSGFRNKDWEEYIEGEGGSVTSTVSNNTTLLIVKDIEEKSSKIIKANELGIEIMSMEIFAKKYNI